MPHEFDTTLFDFQQFLINYMKMTLNKLAKHHAKRVKVYSRFTRSICYVRTVGSIFATNFPSIFFTTFLVSDTVFV